MDNKKIVIKVGTKVLTANTDRLDTDIMSHLVERTDLLIKKGWQVILVTSGAVATGRKIIPLESIKKKKEQRYVAAAIGQPYIMSIYEKLFSKYKIKIAQILLTKKDFTERKRYLDNIKTIDHLLKNGVVPIINENDVVASEELSFDSNDYLAADVSVAISAKYLLILTNQEGLCDSDPEKNPNAKLINEVKNIGKELTKMCSQKISPLSMGGMLSKLKSARIATSAGTTTFIVNGLEKDIIEKVVEGEKVGTKFIASSKEITDKRRWLLTAKTGPSKIIIDKGAENALKKRKSLLVVGIKGLRGEFLEGDVLEIMNKKNMALGYGITNFSSEQISESINKNKKLSREVIHVDNLVII